MLYNFGREDELDKDAVRRLVAALSRLLDPADALAATRAGRAVGHGLAAGRAARTSWTGCGAGWAWTQVDPPASWPGRRLDPTRRAGAVRAGREPGAGRLLQARRRRAGSATTSTSTGWTRSPTMPATGRWTSSSRSSPTWPRQAYFQVTDLLNLEVDLLFFDTTSTYFETEEADEDVPRDVRGERVPDGSEDTARRGRVPHPRQVQGLPRRPAAGRRRDGGHPRRDPGPGLVLARQHRRLRPDPPGQATTCGNGRCRRSSGSPTAASPPRRTAAP